MRLDKYLKVSRLIKRRTVANEACENGKIALNGRVAKPAADVKEGDIIELTLGDKVIRVRVVKITEHVMKSDAVDMYEVIN
ncbi:MAG: RNA-binding S4 domain-containing protein [Clostridia bacterium]|nr:RNA-binding S4 domain-containing protein [Clostridia bacterium]